VSTTVRLYSVSAGDGFTCGIGTGDRVYCWGQDMLGSLGAGQGSGDSWGAQPVASNIRFHQVSAGQYHACAASVDGTVYCWGANGDGELGTRTGDCDAPRAVSATYRYPCSRSPVRSTVRFEGPQVELGQAISCVVDTGGLSTSPGELRCWGRVGDLRSR
jgi:alpha-tubulin suppressor-like RCC1 family protein